MASREFLNEGKIVVYRIDNATRAEVEEWAKLAFQTGDEWTPGTVYRSIQDFHKLPMLTADIKFFAEMVNRFFLEQDFPKMYTAVIIRETSLARLGRVFIEKLGRGNDRIVRRVFFNIEDAVAWLEKV
jgi:hypothetical protein